MAFKLQDFRSAVRDLARMYQFEAQINFPQIVGPTNLANILVKSHTLPKKTLTAVETDFMGQPHFLAGAHQYNDWQCVMRIDDNFDVYKKMRAWSEMMLGTETNVAAFPTAYKSGVNLYQLDVAGNRLCSFELNGAWLSSVGDLTMDNSKHEPIDVTLSFQYDYFVFKVL